MIDERRNNNLPTVITLVNHELSRHYGSGRYATMFFAEYDTGTTIKKILCAVDLTKASHNAFDRALSIARASHARLYVLHAVPPNIRSHGSRANASNF